MVSALKTTQNNAPQTSVLFGPNLSTGHRKPSRIPIKASIRSHGSKQGAESSTFELSEISGLEAPSHLLGHASDKVDHADL